MKSAIHVACEEGQPISLDLYNHVDLKVKKATMLDMDVRDAGQRKFPFKSVFVLKTSSVWSMILHLDKAYGKF